MKLECTTVSLLLLVLSLVLLYHVTHPRPVRGVFAPVSRGGQPKAASAS